MVRVGVPIEQKGCFGSCVGHFGYLNNLCKCLQKRSRKRLEMRVLFLDFKNKMLHSNFIQLALFFAIFLEHLLKIRLVEKSKNPVRSLFQK